MTTVHRLCRACHGHGTYLVVDSDGNPITHGSDGQPVVTLVRQLPERKGREGAAERAWLLKRGYRDEQVAPCLTCSGEGWIRTKHTKESPCP